MPRTVLPLLSVPEMGFANREVPLLLPGKSKSTGLFTGYSLLGESVRVTGLAMTKSEPESPGGGVPESAGNYRP